MIVAAIIAGQLRQERDCGRLPTTILLGCFGRPVSPGYPLARLSPERGQPLVKLGDFKGEITPGFSRLNYKSGILPGQKNVVDARIEMSGRKSAQRRTGLCKRSKPIKSSRSATGLVV